MAKVKSYNFDDALKNDELEERELAANENKKKKKKKRKRNRWMFLFIVLGIIVIYFISDYSNIRIVEMSGNSYYSKQQILNIADVTYDVKSVLSPGFLIEKRLEKDALIKKADVTKSWDGVLKIDISEEKLIGYYTKAEKNYLIVDGEDDVLIEDDAKLANVPYLVNLNSQQIGKYKESIRNIKKESIYLISEISHYETSYDKNMVRLVMQDGHVVFSTFRGLELLDSYTQMLKSLNTDLKCIMFSEETNSMYTEKCE